MHGGRLGGDVHGTHTEHFAKIGRLTRRNSYLHCAVCFVAGGSVYEIGREAQVCSVVSVNANLSEHNLRVGDLCAEDRVSLGERLRFRNGGGGVVPSIAVKCSCPGQGGDVGRGLRFGSSDRQHAYVDGESHETKKPDQTNSHEGQNGPGSLG